MASEEADTMQDEKLRAEQKELDLEKPLTNENKRQARVPEVAAVVSEEDDPTQPCMSFRAIFLGVFFSFAVGGVNMYYWFRDEPVTIGSIVVTLLSYFMGKGMEILLPDWRFNWPWVGEWSLNPGPYNMKEHALVTIFANAGYQSAYAADILVTQRLFYGQNFGPAYGILLILTILGYGMAGLGRTVLVDPPSMWWPANLPTVALFNSLHERTTENRLGKHARFFGIVSFGAFCYYFFPGFIMPILTSLSVMCWFDHSNHIVGTLGAGNAGMGILNFSLDWNTITAFMTSPLPYPVFAILNVMAGTVLLTWIIVPALYYSNTFNAKLFPIISTTSYALRTLPDGTQQAERYNVSRILTPDKLFDEAAYNDYSQLHLSSTFTMTYFISFCGVICVFTHILLYHGKDIVRRYRASRIEDPDIHNVLMDAYETVPHWWFGVVFIITLALSFLTTSYWPTNLPWWGLVLAVLMALVSTIPFGIIQAIANVLPGLNVITELVCGYMLPGRPIANIIFKTYGYISMYQAVTFLSDMKLGFYLKIAPRKLFWAQLWGTIISGIVNYLVMDAILTNVVHDDSEGVLNGDYAPYTLPNASVFFTASIIWGVIGPARMFGPTSSYAALNYGWLIGALLPIPFWLLHQKFPNFGWDNINFPVVFNGMALIPPARPVNYYTWGAIGVFFNYYIRRKFTKWWENYNYVLSAALDTGTAISLLIIAL
ncbi:OPT superfamily oligopeptide transporter [Gonapodya prolifera JEL478]|uniref:OPT superfamily oligopeptide transporter n=1 Tax=Gonapodya prolifera (strain JEL478) TaxID=1344416 RepID=A0A139AJZ0_GONPJ|nr:OPT superfamily oligopeptide transporter [Gonapodya prolifera JEL478]|eukprot:KXS16813.1 OPT superfamily oligopeptide transporter [Gonapodya prolifera JEL478]